MRSSGIGSERSLPMADDRVIGMVEKNFKERLRVALTEYEGHALADLRIYIEGETPGVFDRPTRKGVTFARRLLPEVIDLLKDAAEAADGVTPTPEPDNPWGDQ